MNWKRRACMLWVVGVGATGARVRALQRALCFEAPFRTHTCGNTASEPNKEIKVWYWFRSTGRARGRGAAEFSCGGGARGIGKNKTAHVAGKGEAAERETVERRTKARKGPSTEPRTRARTRARTGVPLLGLRLEVLLRSCFNDSDGGGYHGWGVGRCFTVWTYRILTSDCFLISAELWLRVRKSLSITQQATDLADEAVRRVSVHVRAMEHWATHQKQEAGHCTLHNRSQTSVGTSSDELRTRIEASSDGSRMKVNASSDKLRMKVEVLSDG